jgi:hypothetical protein
MDISSALIYVDHALKAEFGQNLETFVKEKSESSRKEIEQTCFKLMARYPECVYKPLVEAYIALRC